MDKKVRIIEGEQAKSRTIKKKIKYASKEKRREKRVWEEEARKEKEVELKVEELKGIMVSSVRKMGL